MLPLVEEEVAYPLVAVNDPFLLIVLKTPEAG
jgi:hypothetical protein